MGGGPSPEQQAAAAREAQTAQQNAATQQEMLNIWKQQHAKIDPFATDLLKNGLPFMGALTDYNGGTQARAWQPGYAQLSRQLSQWNELPTGFGAQTMADFDASRARDYEGLLSQALMTNQNAKMQGAGLLADQQTASNPLGWAGATTQANNSIMQAPLQSPGWGGVLGGVVGSLGGAALGAFCPAEGALLKMADGIEIPVEKAVEGELIAQYGGGESDLTNTPEPRMEACLEVEFDGGAKSIVGVAHAYKTTDGGYIYAYQSKGATVCCVDGDKKVVNTRNVGKRLVYPINVNGNHTYCVDGAWSLD